MTSKSGQAVIAGLIYFAIVFPVAFVAGAARTLLVAPHLGAFAAVAIEVPLIVTIAWLAWGWIMRRRPLTSAATRVLAGATAFAALMVAELLTAIALGGSAQGFLAGLPTAPGLLGLGGQLAFAAIPAVRR